MQQEGRDPFQQTKYTVTSDAAAIKADFAGMEGRDVSLAGRIMSKRGMGKVLFCDLQDHTGRIQLYVKFDEMPEAQFQDFKKYDIGDIVGVEGDVFQHPAGRDRPSASTRQRCCPSRLLPLPEKFHGLTDTETRYRQRYVDLIVNPEVRRTFEIRSKFVSFVRRYPGRAGLYGGRDAGPQHDLRRRDGTPVYHASQHAGH